MNSTLLKVKKHFSILLCVMMVITTLAPYGAPVEAADGIDVEAGISEITLNKTKVSFAGQSWWVIGQEDDELTLFASIGNHYYREGSAIDEPQGQYQHFFPGVNEPEEYYSYYVHYGDSTFSHPADYEGSSIQKYVAERWADWEMSQWERDMVVAEPDILTKDEAEELPNELFGAISAWTKTVALEDDLGFPGGHSSQFVYAKSYNGMGVNLVAADTSSVAVKITIDISNVVYTTPYNLTNDEGMYLEPNNKLDAEIGGPLLSANPLGDYNIGSSIKYTLLEPDIELNLPAQEVKGGKQLTFAYDSATTGSDYQGNGHVISCVLMQGDTVRYYGKLKNLFYSGSESGTFQIPLEGVAPGGYTLKIFNDTANNAAYSDFVSEPITMELNVAQDGNGTIVEDGTYKTSQTSLMVDGVYLIQYGSVTGNEVENANYWETSEGLTLTLNGYDGGAILANDMDLNISLIGENTVTGGSGDQAAIGASANKVTISGQGNSLNVIGTKASGTAYGIFGENGVDVAGGTIDVNMPDGNDSYAIGSVNQPISIDISSYATNLTASQPLRAPAINITGEADIVEGDDAQTARATQTLTLTQIVDGLRQTANYVSISPRRPPALYRIYVDASPSEGGEVTGGYEDVEENGSHTVTATPNEGYEFVCWTVDGVEVSTDASYTFNVTEELLLTAEFRLEQGSAQEEGSLTVDGTDLVTDGTATGSTVSGASYDPTSHTLTLNGYNGGAIIATDMDLHLVIQNDNTVTDGKETMGVIQGFGFSNDPKVTITGNGTLNVISTKTSAIAYGVFGLNGVSIEGAQINISLAAEDWVYGIGADSAPIHIDVANGARVTAFANGKTANAHALAANEITINGNATIKEGNTAEDAQTVSALTLTQIDVGQGTKRYVSITPSSGDIPNPTATPPTPSTSSAPTQTPASTQAPANPPAHTPALTQAPVATQAPTASQVDKIVTPLNTVYVQAGKSFTIPYVVYSGNAAVKENLTWKSNNKNVKVTQSGKVTVSKQLKKGKAIITATASNGKQLRVTVHVLAKKVSLKKFSVKGAASLKKGKSAKLTVKLTPKKATGVSANFKSSNPKGLQVDKTGLMTAKKPGKYTITVKMGGITVKKNITVK